ncbi:hypothetical protein [Bradyrhizobium centrosematis]|uniref:hypothetical protein n=1 Tax=Bradyrhizobium centrosematis TaxID=1300039 RepID=UPI00216A95AB|nr:hypothetical protein [Bradyrhizobium centrosematis]MCS3759658.1 hypothetical protein [Bradyrhizobium centrosematis]MCS3772453.1 hypothetical protein [Bradyrhizobium centrosematis]
MDSNACQPANAAVASAPPITSIRITSVGVVSQRSMTSGSRMLSRRPTTKRYDEEQGHDDLLVDPDPDDLRQENDGNSDLQDRQLPHDHHRFCTAASDASAQAQGDQSAQLSFNSVQCRNSPRPICSFSPWLLTLLLGKLAQIGVNSMA